MKYAVVYRATRFPSLAKLNAAERGDASPNLYWFHAEDRFCFKEGPRTLYATREEAEGGILWIIARKGQDYMGDELEVEEVHERVGDRVDRADREIRSERPGFEVMGMGRS